jgi:stearoyl-CoA desaturase (delta-9 desaturase)
MPEDCVSAPAGARYRPRPVKLVVLGFLHVAPLLAIYTGTRHIDWLVCAVLYVVRMFGITAGYHRYFAHRSFKTSRAVQFLLALLGTMALQKGVLWWAGLHRIHHEESDTPEDFHSPVHLGFWRSHIWWLLSRQFEATPFQRIPDFARFRELRWLNQYWMVPPVCLSILLALAGGWSMFLIGFCLSTVVLQHATLSVNSVAHLFGTRPFPTRDCSRNNAVLALFTLGEGWHNNHHYYMSCANQGFRWWEVDIAYYAIRLMQLAGLVWDVRRPPRHVLETGRQIASES